MIIYDLKCTDGHRFEAVVASMFDDLPPCSDCGASTRKIPAAVGLSGSASAGPSREQMPNTWSGINRGDRETVRGWHQAMTKREKLEEKYPELAGDRRPVLAHEGAFADAPLRAGDPLAATVAEATFRPAGTATTASKTTQQHRKEDKK
ncbi:zinc ribbon domain-containing protein [Pseudarthrobacter sp. Fe7]|nr:zinc ribbon domain-containing protein [Pseudarthrobacter sp. Fe7]